MGWLELLRRYAPSWLLQLPALVSANEGAALQLRVGNTIRERMLRELAEALEAVTAEYPVLLVLEDLHWSDASTVDWLAYRHGGGRGRGCWWWGRIGRSRPSCGRIPSAP